MCVFIALPLQLIRATTLSLPLSTPPSSLSHGSHHLWKKRKMSWLSKLNSTLLSRSLHLSNSNQTTTIYGILFNRLTLLTDYLHLLQQNIGGLEFSGTARYDPTTMQTAQQTRAATLTAVKVGAAAAAARCRHQPRNATPARRQAFRPSTPPAATAPTCPSGRPAQARP